MKTKNLLYEIVKERPVGTENNEKIIALLRKEFLDSGYKVTFLPFQCLVWRKGPSTLKVGNVELEIQASPYSRAFDGMGEGIIIDDLATLQTEHLTDKIVILRGNATQRPIQPKDYPFYYPDEDKEIILRLESQKPKAIIAMTGQAQLSGMNPFPMFIDGNFSIPSAYTSENKWDEIKKVWHQNKNVSLTIASENREKQSNQLIAYKKGLHSREKIIICAHMDTQYETMGALDNGTGVAVLMAVMQRLKEVECTFDIDFVPFNTEEYFGANGELSYLEYLDKQQKKVLLVINIDSPCHIHSNSAVSYYNMNKDQECIIDEIIQLHKGIEKGEVWYAGDHCAFAFRGIPCLAVSSSDLFQGALAHTHTPEDTLLDIDEKLIEETAEFLVEVIKSFNKILNR